MNDLPPILILAGGFGTRINNQYENIPKYLIPIHNEPFAFHQLRLLKKMGFYKVISCVGYRSESIVNCLGNGDQFELNLQYSFDGDESLGTGGAIQKALHLVQSHFGVIYGDSYLSFNANEAYQIFLKK